MRVLPAVCGIFALAALATPAGAGTVTFHIFNDYFSLNPPDQPIVSDATINLGDKVHWVWDQGVHSVAPVKGSIVQFDSGDQGPPFTFDHTFTQPGKITFFCDLHAFDNGDGTVLGTMQGTITVLPEPAGIGLIGLAGCALLRRRRR